MRITLCGRLCRLNVIRRLPLALQPWLKCVGQPCGGVSDGFPLLSEPQRRVRSLQTHSDGPGEQTSCTKTRSTLREEQPDLDGEQPEPGGGGRLLPVVRRPFTRRPVILTVWCGRLRAGGSPGLHSCCNDGGGEGGGAS